MLTKLEAAINFFLGKTIFKRVVALDLRGYGDSEKPYAANQYDLYLFVDDIYQLILKLGLLTL